MEVLEPYPDQWQQESPPDDDSDDDDDMSCCSIDSDGAIFDPNEDYTHEIKPPTYLSDIRSIGSKQQDTPDCEQDDLLDAGQAVLPNPGVPNSTSKEQPLLIGETEGAIIELYSLIEELPDKTKETTVVHAKLKFGALEPSLKKVSETVTSKTKMSESRIEASSGKQRPIDDEQQPTPGAIETEKEMSQLSNLAQSTKIGELDHQPAPPILVKPKKEPLSPKQKKWKKRIVANKNRKEEKNGCPKERKNAFEYDEPLSDVISQEDSSWSSTLESIPEIDEERVDTEAPSATSIESSEKEKEEDPKAISIDVNAYREEDIAPTEDKLEGDNKIMQQVDIEQFDAAASLAAASLEEVFDYSNYYSENTVCDETNQVQDDVLVAIKDKEPIAPILAQASNDEKETIDGVKPREVQQAMNDNSEDAKAVDELEDNERGADEEKSLCMEHGRTGIPDPSDCVGKSDQDISHFLFEVSSTDRTEDETDGHQRADDISLEVGKDSSDAIEETQIDVVADLEKCSKMDDQSDLISAGSAIAANEDEQNDAMISLCGDPSSWLKRSNENKPWYIKPIQSKKESTSTAREESAVPILSSECTDNNDEDDECALLLNENAEAKHIEEGTTITTQFETLDDSVNGVMDSEEEDDESATASTTEEASSANTDPNEVVTEENDNDDASIVNLSEVESDSDSENLQGSTSSDLYTENSHNSYVEEMEEMKFQKIDIDVSVEAEENEQIDEEIENDSDSDSESLQESTSSDVYTTNSHNSNVEETDIELSNAAERNGQVDEENPLDSSDESSPEPECTVDVDSLSTSSHDSTKTGDEEIIIFTADVDEDNTVSKSSSSSDDSSGNTEVSEENSSTEDLPNEVLGATLDQDSVEEGTKLSIDTDFSEILDLFDYMKIERNERNAKEVEEIMDVFREMKAKGKTKEEMVDKSSVDSPESQESTVCSKQQEQEVTGDDGSCVFIETQNKNEIDDAMSELSSTMRTMRTLATNKAMVEDSVRGLPPGGNDVTDGGFWKTSSAAAQVVLDSCSEDETKEEESVTYSNTSTGMSDEEQVCIETIMKDGNVEIVEHVQDLASAEKAAENAPTGDDFWTYLCCCTANNSCKTVPWYVMPEVDPTPNLDESVHGNVVSRGKIMRDLNQSQMNKDGSPGDDRVMEMVLFDHQ